jgi:hypothetical protein
MQSLLGNCDLGVGQIIYLISKNFYLNTLHSSKTHGIQINRILHPAAFST